MAKNKNTKVIVKRDLIKDVANCVPYNTATVKEIYDMLETRFFKILSLATDGNPVKIKLFDGVSVESVYCPETEKKNNLTGEIITCKPKIKPKFNITDNYIEKLTKGEF